MEDYSEQCKTRAYLFFAIEGHVPPETNRLEKNITSNTNQAVKGCQWWTVDAVV